MDQLEQAMGTLDQGGTGPLALKIRARDVFSTEEWTRTMEDLPRDQKGSLEAALSKTLAEETVKALTWDSWERSFEPFTQTWSLVCQVGRLANLSVPILIDIKVRAPAQVLPPRRQRMDYR